ncbi:MAG: hypothetical protein KJ064_00920 [Anaerolineae bacterium]|nr:hypothetical protein [Anaerolineae bacterium]
MEDRSLTDKIRFLMSIGKLTIVNDGSTCYVLPSRSTYDPRRPQVTLQIMKPISARDVKKAGKL